MNNRSCAKDIETLINDEKNNGLEIDAKSTRQLSNGNNDLGCYGGAEFKNNIDYKELGAL